MKKDLGLVQAVSPMPVLMIAAYDENEKVNVMNVAWGQICDEDKIILFIGEGKKTWLNTKASKAFTVALADREHMDVADFFGIASGNKITLPKASALTSPNPVTLVCTQKPDGSTNLATVSWWTYLSFNPSMIAYAMAKTSYSGEMVRSGKKVILTIPGKALKDVVMDCGMSTGRDTDKITKFRINMQNLPDCAIQIPEHSRVAIQCTLKEYHEVGDHYLYICNVDQVFSDEKEEALFAWEGYAKIAPAMQGE